MRVLADPYEISVSMMKMEMQAPTKRRCQTTNLQGNRILSQLAVNFPFLW